MAKVALAEVHKYYDEVHVVKGVSLTVEPGEFVVLLGPSGCGKSTCLRMIAGLEEVSKGDVRIGDKVVNDVRPKDRDIGMVFQSYALYPHMTVRDNLAFGLRLRKESAAVVDKRIAEAAEMLELGELLDRKPAKLSGGQRQRVAIGRAIVKQPAVFLFDEPLSNLDAALRVQMRTEIARLHERIGTTMVYVTHDQIEAMMLADRLAVLAGGVLQQVGRPLDVYRRPANRFVANFIGSPSMNFLPIDDSGEGSISVAGETVELDGLAKLSGPHELGVRPEDMTVSVADSASGIAGTVSLIELLGWQANVHVDVSGHTVIARVESSVGDELSRGQKVRLSFSPQACHVFDGAGESVHCGADAEPG